jgi:competence CoiA-like predicted nuclease
MLVAVNENGENIYAYEAKKNDENGQKINYYCPECGCELILRQGTKNIWHFAHKDSQEVCIFRKYDNESPQHIAMKFTIKELIERDNDCLISELEYRVGSKIADYYFEVKDKWGSIKKIAVEK